MKDRFLEVSSILKSFGNKTLLSDIYFKCKIGETIGILGRNGSGKSTLLKIIFGIEEVENKSIRFDNVTYEKPFEKGNLIGYLPQNQFLPKNQTLKQIVKIYSKDVQVQKNILANSRIKPHVSKKPAELSGGERRFFEVLLLLNLPVPFILLDEPFSSVEPIYRSEIKELITLYRRKKGIILTDHDYANLMSVSDHVLLIDRGVSRSITQKSQLIDFNYLPPQRSMAAESDSNIFEVDQQTLKDLGLSSKEPNSILSIFGEPASKGGKSQLEKLVHSPTRNRQILEDRQLAIKFFQNHRETLTIDKKQLDFIDFYFDSNVQTLSTTKLDALIFSIRNKWRESNDHYIKQTGVRFTYDFLREMSLLSNEILRLQSSPYLSSIAFKIQEIINSKDIREFVNNFENESLFVDINARDYLLRKKCRQDLIWLLESIYTLEVFQTIAGTTKDLDFSFPEYFHSETTEIEIKGLIHPQIQNAIPNNFLLSETKNICFLTGANMAGKSSFLKAFGISIYLAHLGFPVPASSMKTSLFDGLVSTINLSDNLNLGLSHFYSEVMRVKDIANQLNNNKKLVVIFDELFRGTNVKDAAQASSMIIKALTKIEDSLFVISSHILEIARELEKSTNIFFQHFVTELENSKPKYTYKLKDGVTAESLGINIVLNEGILDLLERKLPPTGAKNP